MVTGPGAGRSAPALGSTRARTERDGTLAIAVMTVLIAIVFGAGPNGRARPRMPQPTCRFWLAQASLPVSLGPAHEDRCGPLEPQRVRVGRPAARKPHAGGAASPTVTTAPGVRARATRLTPHGHDAAPDAQAQRRAAPRGGGGAASGALAVVLVVAAVAAAVGALHWRARGFVGRAAECIDHTAADSSHALQPPSASVLGMCLGR